MFATLLLIALVLTAAATDAARRKIYNWTTYPGMLAGLVLAVLGAGADSIWPGTFEAWRPFLGWLTISDAAAGFVVCGFIMLVCFVFFGKTVGGGDVKLLTMVGTLAGLDRGLEILLWTFILAGCLGLTVLIWRIGAITIVKRAGQLLVGAATLGIWLSVPRKEKEVLRSPIFLAPSAAAALAAVLLPWPWTI